MFVEMEDVRNHALTYSTTYTTFRVAFCLLLAAQQVPRTTLEGGK